MSTFGNKSIESEFVVVYEAYNMNKEEFIRKNNDVIESVSGFPNVCNLELKEGVTPEDSIAKMVPKTQNQVEIKEWANNLVVVQKLDSSLMYLDLKELNTGLVRKQCQVPTMEDITPKFLNKKINRDNRSTRTNNDKVINKNKLNFNEKSMSPDSERIDRSNKKTELLSHEIPFNQSFPPTNSSGYFYFILAVVSSTYRLVIMVGLNSANEINSSEYYTYVPYDHTRAFYYENLGSTKVIGAKIIIQSLKMKNIKNICTDKHHIDLCGKCQIVYDEITNQKERLYMLLGGILFDVCDDKCAKKTREAIKQTEETGANILHIVKSQTTVVKIAVKKIASSLNQTEELYKEISTKEQKLHERMIQLQNKTDDVLDLLLASGVHNLYTIITNQYAYETSTLEQIITAAREGLIHPSFMTPQELASTLKKAERTIKKQYSIPMGTEAPELSEFLKITKISVNYENEQLVFIIRIPLVIDVELSLYNIIPIPTNHVQDEVEAWYVSIATYTYVAITKDRKQFTTYTEKEIITIKIR
ncbi:hypothetical protein AGLY_009051 [Aphis glycines]|uniref:Uncharacterized protein n=1 Tax=Aphis glycines TaxID=307491 RepID=A0A6G0TK64_APHGL|nr:hypothetical protein AGLY_009051 [Aphis glycines]